MRQNFSCGPSRINEKRKMSLITRYSSCLSKGHREEALLEYCDPRELFVWLEITEQSNGLCPQQHFRIYQCYNAEVKCTRHSRCSHYSFHSLAETMDNVHKSYICVFQRVFSRILIL